jgi:hypothetical protein
MFYLRKRCNFGNSRNFLFSFLEIKLNEEVEFYYDIAWEIKGQSSNKLNITKSVLKVKKKGKTLLSRKHRLRSGHRLRCPKTERPYKYSSTVYMTETILLLMYWKANLCAGWSPTLEEKVPTD